MLLSTTLMLIRTIMSAFTDFINLLKMKVNIYHNAKVCGDWIINEHTLGATCFHIVTTGRCMLNVPGYLETEFNTGDLVIFPHELEHHMRAIDTMDREQQHLSYHSTLQGTGLLCGEVSVLHRYQNQLLDALPPVLFIKNDEQAPWLNHLVSLFLQESLRDAEETLETLNRLSEMLFIYALRHYLDQGDCKPGILLLYGSPRLAKAIKAFNNAPEQKWNLSTLAKQAGMSRTSFAETFKRKSGWTVNQYTHWWRMQLAWEKLEHGDTVSNVAYAVGYQSEAAFSRAFKKQFETNAGNVRRNSA